MTHLVVFSHLRWGFVYQRPQHLLSRLAARFPVLFVEEPTQDLAGEPRLEAMPQPGGLEVLCPHTPLDSGGFADDQLGLIGPMVRRELAARGIGDYVVWFYTPLALPALEALAPRAVVYDCMDELASFRGAPRSLREREAALMKQADLVFTGGPALYAARRSQHHSVHCLPSAVDAAHFSPAGRDLAGDEALIASRLHQAVGPGPRLGYYGVIDERLDLQLVAELARSRPDWQIVMVGPVAKVDPTSLPRADNLHWLGMQPYALLPHLAAQWDVCLMPFALNDATRFISPTKTLEYMAAEKPVVSTPVTDVVALYGDVVRVAGGTDAFVAECEAALSESPLQAAQRVQASLATVRRMSWDATAQRIEQLIARRLDENGHGLAHGSGARPATPARRVDATRVAPMPLRSGGLGVAPSNA